MSLKIRALNLQLFDCSWEWVPEEKAHQIAFMTS